MPSKLTTVEVTGKDSSSLITAKVNAVQALERELTRLDLVDVGDVQTETHVFGKGRFYVVAKVQARPR